jgi:hypothetical protein
MLVIDPQEDFVFSVGTKSIGAAFAAMVVYGTSSAYAAPGVTPGDLYTEPPTLIDKEAAR